MREYILEKLSEIENGYSVCGVIDKRSRIYPLGSDTKVLSTIFELVTKQVVVSYADKHGLKVVEPDKQNYYPDFTLLKSEQDDKKIAIDVKTTYRKHKDAKFSFTLGGYTSFIQPHSPGKNIVFPFTDYSEHWIIGFVYEREQLSESIDTRIYSVDEIDEIRVPFREVEVFMRQKWEIAGDRAGSGNTTNIGSINGTIEDFRHGRGLFSSEEEFLKYWRSYKKTGQERKSRYSNIEDFRETYG